MLAHLFFPENDIALGRDIVNYTAPRAAVALRLSGQLLPVWFMAPDDCVVAQQVDEEWLDLQRRRFGMSAGIYDGCSDGLMPAPWGWSRASRRQFERLGFGAEALPSDADLDRIRALSHRRTALCIARHLQASGLSGTPVGLECSSIDEVEEYVASAGEAVIKLPWSSTGRGIVMIGTNEFDTFRKQIAGMIANQGSVCCEPRLRCVQDLALLFTIARGKVSYDGLSVFRNAASGTYEGNILAPQAVLERICSDLLGDDSLRRAQDALPQILENLIGDAYDGPLGVDMMIYECADGSRALDGCIELNLRNTMGHVARRFFSRYCRESFRGMLRVGGACAGDDPLIVDGRLSGGSLRLNPPGNAFSFLAEGCGELL